MHAAPAAQKSPGSTSVRITRGIGWTLIVLGGHILLYLVYLLWWTGLSTSASQARLLEDFAIEFGDPDAATLGAFGDTVDDERLQAGDTYAAMWFERDGERIITEKILYVVQGVDLGSLRKGPGHEPRSSAVGGDGNFVVSGHRTTYGAPFYNLDQLQAGDEVHVVDRAGHKWVYDVREQLIVAPTDVWVTRRRAFGDQPTMTMTTCNPRFSAAQRLIVWGELRLPTASDEPSEAAA